MRCSLSWNGAQNNLGDLYESDEGVPQNQKVAIYWYTQTSERGEPTSHFSLASLVSEGSDDPEILAESMKFATLAFMFLPAGKNQKLARQLASNIDAKLTEATRASVSEAVNRWVPLFKEGRIQARNATLTNRKKEAEDV